MNILTIHANPNRKSLGRRFDRRSWVTDKPFGASS